MIRHIANSVKEFNREYPLRSQEKFLMDFIESLLPDSEVLDYGCGMGRILRLIHGKVSATGVDLNEHNVELNKGSGFNCMTTDEFQRGTQKFDAIILSHVLEHLAYTEAYTLLDKLLNRLNEGGKLVIFSPLMNPDFYETFDHVKPYGPNALEDVFGNGEQPTQFQRKRRLNRIRLEYGYAKRWVKYFIPRNFMERFAILSINTLYLFGYLICPRLFGIPNAWMAIYKKVHNSGVD